MRVHDHPYNRHPESDEPLIEFIYHECQHKAVRPLTILDVGCGTGIFIQKVLEISLRQKKEALISVTVFEDNRFSKNYDYENKVAMKSRELLSLNEDKQ
jgi:hypothetical protein